MYYYTSIIALLFLAILEKTRVNDSMSSEKSEKWPPENEDLFVQLLVEYVHNGSIIRGTANKALWVQLANAMNPRASKVWTPSQLLSKYGRLRKDHNDFSGLLNHETGFGWDPVLNTVSGTPTQWERAKMVCFIPN
jgi:hypothetical protein